MHVLELLAGLMLIQANAATLETSSAYANPTLSGFVSIENTRVIDGAAYGDGDGMLGGGLIYAHPTGLFAGTELLAGNGDGLSLPGGTLLALQAFAGYTAAVGEHRFAVQLLEYRLQANDDAEALESADATFNYPGIGFTYRRGPFQVELAREFDRPYFYHYQNRFFRYDTSRLVIGWQQDFSESLAWSLGAGMNKLDWVDADYRYVTASLKGRFRDLRWRLGYSHAGEDLDALYGHIDRGQWLLRIALPFHIF